MGFPVLAQSVGCVRHESLLTLSGFWLLTHPTILSAPLTEDQMNPMPMVF